MDFRSESSCLLRGRATTVLVAMSLLFLSAATPPALAATVPGKAMHQYLYVLKLVPRLHDPKAWTSRDHASVSAHFKRLQEATARGRVILAGRTDEPLDQSFGLVVFEAPDDVQARAFMDHDPTVLDGVMVATLHPYSVALLRDGRH